MTPQLVQSLKLMSLPYAELREQIFEELEKNPALEIESDPIESYGLRDRYIGASTPGVGTVGSGGDEESDEHRDFIEGVLHHDETLQEHLLAQLGEIDLDPAVRSVAELVVQNLDADGFHIVPPAELAGVEIASASAARESPVGDGLAGDRLAAALEAVRRLEPSGCATADFRESLSVQARLLATGGKRVALDAELAKDPLLAKTVRVIENHFETLERGRADTLAKALQKTGDPSLAVDADEAEGILEIVRSLDPFPGRAYDREPGSWIAPDVIVRRTEDGLSAEINGEEIPVLRVSPEFLALEEADPAAVDRTARDFAREPVRDAQWFVHTLKRREETILKVVSAIIDYQRDFFLYGPSKLAPLRMKDIADETGMHEATVSRAANGKYLRCEWGLFEIKYFFSNQVGSGSADSSGQFSKQGVKETIRKIVEESESGLSDQKIADLLASRGIKIARRTVAKYRAELDLGSSFDRPRG